VVVKVQLTSNPIACAGKGWQLPPGLVFTPRQHGMGFQDWNVRDKEVAKVQIQKLCNVQYFSIN
jgi:hypothetical protein